MHWASARRQLDRFGAGRSGRWGASDERNLTNELSFQLMNGADGAEITIDTSDILPLEVEQRIVSYLALRDSWIDGSPAAACGDKQVMIDGSDGSASGGLQESEGQGFDANNSKTPLGCRPL
jgi:hypothetical protein